MKKLILASILVMTTLLTTGCFKKPKPAEIAKEINNYSEKEQLLYVKKNCGYLNYITNPSEKVQLAGVKRVGSCIKYLNNPSEKVQLAAVAIHGNHIDCDIIKYINNPTEKVKLTAIQICGQAIQFIENPSVEMQLAAINKNNKVRVFTDLNRYIKNPSKKAQLFFVKDNYYGLEEIKNPSEEVKIAAIQSNWKAIRYIENPTEEMKLLAINNDDSMTLPRYYLKEEIAYPIELMKNPSEKLQLASINKSCKSISGIKNPTKKVINIIRGERCLKEMEVQIKCYPGKIDNPTKYSGIHGDPNRPYEVAYQKGVIEAKLAYQNNKHFSSKYEAKNYCTDKANHSFMKCGLAHEYVSGCVKKLGF